jgi:hypothetical protein
VHRTDGAGVDDDPREVDQAGGAEPVEHQPVQGVPDAGPLPLPQAVQQRHAALGPRRVPGQQRLDRAPQFVVHQRLGHLVLRDESPAASIPLLGQGRNGYF